VHEGRRKFLRQFTQYASAEAQARILDPAATETFERSKLDFTERDTHRPILDLHRDLLRLRREDPVVSGQLREQLDGAVLGERAFLLRWFDARHGDRLLIVNLGSEIDLRPAPEPLLAPPEDSQWKLIWSSDDPRYGGPGLIQPCEEGCWRLPAESASFLVRSEAPSGSNAS
jgi:maltooligosyltrehalose trehalohydrolase